MKKSCLILTLVIASCVPKKGAEENPLLKPGDFQAKIAAMPGAMVLDVRTPEEVASGRIKGALNFDFKSPEFKVLIKGLDRHQPYFVYCAKGSRSSKAADMMRDMDFEKVYALEGGIEAWKAEGLPVNVPPAAP
jgi:rhodanese-related sulfurtransferase